MSTSLFKKNQFYSRREIAEILGGGNEQAYLVSQEGLITAGCFRLDLNPRAPEAVYPGFGRDIERNAETASLQEEPFPVFLKRGNKEYEYVGDYRGAGLSRSLADIEEAEELSGRGAADPISGVLRLQPVRSDPMSRVSRCGLIAAALRARRHLQRWFPRSHIFHPSINALGPNFLT